MPVCDICTEALPSEAAVRRHMRRAHLERQPRCPLCGAAAPGYDELRRHVEELHPEPAGRGGPRHGPLPAAGAGERRARSAALAFGLRRLQPAPAAASRAPSERSIPAAARERPRGRAGLPAPPRRGPGPAPMCLPPARSHEAAAMTSGGGSRSLRPWEPDPGPGGRGRPLPLVFSVCVWLGTGTTMASLNKWIFAIHNFRYPLLLSSLHMLSAVAVGYPLARLRAPGPVARPRARIYLLSATFCSSVAFGNLGLNYVQLDVAQVVYTTTPLFTLLLSALLLRRRHHPLQYVAMVPVCAGAACSVLGQVRVHQAGCCFLFAATFLRGLKSIQQSLLLQEHGLDAVSLLCLTSLPSFCILFSAAAALEVGPAWAGVLRYDSTLWAYVLLSCLGSVLYNLASFCVLSLTSALTIHVLGNFNVVGNLLLSRLLFGSQLSGLSYMGIGLTLAGMFMYHQPDYIAACWASWRGRDRGKRE